MKWIYFFVFLIVTVTLCANDSRTIEEIGAIKDRGEEVVKTANWAAIASFGTLCVSGINLIFVIVIFFVNRNWIMRSKDDDNKNETRSKWLAYMLFERDGKGICAIAKHFKECKGILENYSAVVKCFTQRTTMGTIRNKKQSYSSEIQSSIRKFREALLDDLSSIFPSTVEGIEAITILPHKNHPRIN